MIRLFNRKKCFEEGKTCGLVPMLGQPQLKQSSLDTVYQDYSPEQLAEVIDALEDTIRFLTYQKSLSFAYHQEHHEELQYLLREKLSGNLVYLRKDGGWLLKVLVKNLEE